MDVVEFLVSLLDVHKQQLKALTRQGEIQAKVLSQLVKDGLTRTLDRPSPQDVEEQRSQPIRPQGLSNAFQTRVLGQMWTVEDQSRQDFLSLRYEPQKGARELGQRLDSAAKHWLRPDLRTAAQVEQCVAMEQFLSLLPKEAGAWVQKQQPRDMEEAISMAEQRLGSAKEPGGAQEHSHWGEALRLWGVWQGLLPPPHSEQTHTYPLLGKTLSMY
uniref:SCAN box domain-containing protein n=1 Tax=Hucho hucho TaxID=62062 RepID=A0A4W5KPB1_9TELE